MINDNSLDDWVVSTALCETEFQLIVLHALVDSSTFEINTIVSDIDFDELFVSGVFRTCIFNNIKILNHNSLPNFNIENSLPLVFEIHFSKLHDNSVLALFDRQFISHLLIGMSLIHIKLFV